MALAFDNVSLTYAAADASVPVRALDQLNLRVESGESVAIIGPSGCGKSSTLRLACGLMTPTAGTVTVDGAQLTAPRAGTALILQDFGLLPWKTVFANAELGLRIRKIPATERTERVQAALDTVGLTGFEKRFPAELSGGMQQRLALARALAMDTDTLLMDEPLSALDALLREDLQNTLLALWQKRGYTQILVTHSIEEAVFLGQRVVVMAPRPGRIVAEVQNPDMGAADYRKDERFFARCREVRAALEAALQESACAEAQGGTHE